ncbi:MAG: TIGR03619 family F420-dependent LLM class oxidoreductase [Actinomycetota bacterium]|jgi:alkanesulfonate monooxygenase|nr:TIGR03619 family F420-dependent LLM class oxidoreductase [Actinomycetota bacterium]
MSVRFGLAVENFTPATKNPDFEAIRNFVVTAEQLGYSSFWTWDHLFLGSRRPFPFLEALTTLSAIASFTKAAELGTGVLVLPLREPVALAKTAATIQAQSGGRLTLGMAAGWYKREFDAVGIPFEERGRVFERNLDIVRALWDEDDVTGEIGGRRFTHVSMLPRPHPAPKVLIGGYVDRVLRRVATRSDGWITYFYTAQSFERSWAKVQHFAEQAGRDPGALENVAQLPLCIGPSFEEATERGFRYVADYFDVAEWSESTRESTVRGTPEQCAEQIQAHIDAGVKHVVLCPCDYAVEQVERFAEEVLPLLGVTSPVLPG